MVVSWDLGRGRRCFKAPASAFQDAINLASAHLELSSANSPHEEAAYISYAVANGPDAGGSYRFLLNSRTSGVPIAIDQIFLAGHVSPIRHLFGNRQLVRLR